MGAPVLALRVGQDKLVGPLPVGRQINKLMINEPSKGAKGAPRTGSGQVTPNANINGAQGELNTRCRSNALRLAVRLAIVGQAGPTTSSEPEQARLAKSRTSFGSNDSVRRPELASAGTRGHCYKLHSNALLHLGLASGKFVVLGNRLKGKTIRLLLLMLLARLAGGASASADQAEPSATLRNQASLRGVWLAPGVAGFLGIRYASAPVKRLRFMPPSAFQYAPRQIHSARRFGPICMQSLPVQYEQGNARGRLAGRQAHLGPLVRHLQSREQSEDCLNLNVYAPGEALAKPQQQQQQQHQQQALPVLAIIHGESFDFGAGSSLDGAPFVGRTGQLVVTLNYRLNLLGFPPKLDGASRGNLGLMDQVAALHWIRSNIGAFGGSPDNITLMGTKRAAIFVNLLMLSPLSKGLFRRAIIEDGSALTPMLASSRQQGAQQAALHHLRIVAALSECPIAVRQQQAGGQMTNLDESRLNAAMFECLRSKPAELMVRRVPLELIHLSSWPASHSGGPGQLPPLQIQARWLRFLGLHQATNGSSLDGQDSLVPVDARQIEQLVQRALDEAPAGALLEALFPANQVASLAARPTFAPIVDGSVVPEEELAQLMLRPSSHFGQFDLLVGLSGSALSGAPTGEQDPFGLEQPIGARLGQSLAESGLTNEQAVELVTGFARAHYRYHVQEIANSILGQYLAVGTSASDKPRSVFMLDSLLEAFQDSLVNVVTLRVAIIHAVRQLESALELYLEDEHQHPDGSSFVARARARPDGRRSSYLFQLSAADELRDGGGGGGGPTTEAQPRTASSFTCAFERLNQARRPADESACERLTDNLASFVETGKLGSRRSAATSAKGNCAAEHDSHSVQAGPTVCAEATGRPLDWPMFDLFTWRAVRPAASAESWFELSPGFLARASFWSNFIAALNCSRTQPVVPSELGSADDRSSALLNLNLLFICNNQQPGELGRRAGEALELLEARAQERHRAALAASKVSPAPDQSSQHSLRMANVSQPAGSVDVPAPASQDERPQSGAAGAPGSSLAKRELARVGFAGLSVLVGALVLLVGATLLGCRRRHGPSQADQADPACHKQAGPNRASDELQPGESAKHVSTLEPNQDDQARSQLQDQAAGLVLGWPQLEQSSAEVQAGQHLCRSHSQSLLAGEQPFMVPILSSSIGRSSSASNRRRRVQISEPQVQLAEPPAQLFCPVHRQQDFYLNAPELWAQQLELSQVELQAYHEQQLANYANQLQRLDNNQ